MNLKFAEYILALDQEHNVTRAAAKLGISQGALSNYLIKQETELGYKIFIRTKNLLIPTPVGKLYIDTLRQMLDIKSYAYQSIKSQCGSETETIRIGVSPSRGLKHLTDAYFEFTNRCPNVKIDIREEYVSRLKSMIQNDEIDMFFGALVEEEIESEYWSSYKVARTRLVAAAHRFLLTDYPENAKINGLPRIRCEQLEGLPVILHGTLTSIRNIQDKMFLEQRFSPVIIAEGNNTKMVISLIARGLGVGFIPEHYIYDDDMADVMAFYLEPDVYIYRCIAMSRKRAVTHAAKTLADIMWNNAGMKSSCI